MVFAVNTGVVNTLPTKATDVKAASLYQVNTGLVTVVLLAVNTAATFPQIDLDPVTVTSACTALGFTTTVIGFAVTAVFSHLFVPLTVT